MSGLHGILILNKPAGWTSHDCVAKVRRLAGLKKVGHTGTLDPEVTGVLPLCLGQATKLVEFMILDEKEYMAEMTLGKSTTTQDQTGEMIVDQPVHTSIGHNRIEEVLHSFIGDIKQIPPMYSALKQGGQKLYQLARKGIEVPREARTVHIKEMVLLDFHAAGPYPRIQFRVKCSKGTYIRTLAVDIGQKLGCPAHMSSLQRTRSGQFQLQQTFTMSQIMAWAQADWVSNLLPLDAGLDHMPIIRPQQTLIERILNGQTVPIDQRLIEGKLYRIRDQSDQLIAVYEALSPNWIKPIKVFHL